jgi:hypothetical protein
MGKPQVIKIATFMPGFRRIWEAIWADFDTLNGGLISKLASFSSYKTNKAKYPWNTRGN